MRIEIVFAGAAELWRQSLDVSQGATVGEAYAISDFARLFPEHAHPMPPLGVYGERCEPERVLAPDDRIEIYRPLVFDPLESRRRRAQHRLVRLKS